MILAQALGEYAGLSSFGESLRALRIRVEDMLGDLEPVHYGFILLAIVALWLLLGRRS